MAAPTTREELRAKLTGLGISIIREESHDAVETCEAQVGVVEDASCVAKNLLLVDKKKKKWLCVVKSDRKVDTKALRKAVGANKSLRFCGDSKAILGCAKGSLTPFGVANEAARAVTVLLDASFALDKPISVHPVGEAGNTATWTLLAGSSPSRLLAHRAQLCCTVSRSSTWQTVLVTSTSRCFELPAAARRASTLARAESVCSSAGALGRSHPSVRPSRGAPVN